MKICPDCKCSNPDDAVFCRNCGADIKTIHHKNVTELYPKLNLTPTNFYNWRKPWISRIIYVISIISLVIFLCLVVCSLHDEFFHRYKHEVSNCDGSDVLYSTYYYGWLNSGVGYSHESPNNATKNVRHDYYEVVHFGLALSTVLLIISILLAVYSFKRFPKNNLRECSDYVQRYHYTGLFNTRKSKIYIFFVKNNKFGVLDYVHYNVVLPAQYDYLEWHTNRKYLNAKLNGETFIIDINGNRLK